MSTWPSAGSRYWPISGQFLMAADSRPDRTQNAGFGRLDCQRCETAKVDELETLAAGDFSNWLAMIGGVLRREGGSDVPCGSCTACCTSSQFIHIEPDEADPLAHIPKTLLFSAPGLPPGNVLMGYDRRGRCPMLIDGACSIYDHRPRTCRAYDCRVFPATGLSPDDDKPLIQAQSKRWEFERSARGEVEYKAVTRAASFLTEHRDELPGGSLPSNPTQLAAMSLALHESFLAESGEEAGLRVVEPTVESVSVEILRRRRPS